MNMYIPSFFPVLIDKTLAISGVADWHVRHYQIDESKMPATFFIDPEWKARSLIYRKSFMVEGILVYSLNNVKLLCPATIKHDYLNMLRFVPWNSGYDKKQAKILREHAAKCQPFTQGGVVRVSAE